MLGHEVVVFNCDRKAGGLNEYGIAAYKTVDDFAQKEVEYILSIGGVEIRNGVSIGKELSIDDLRQSYDAVFLGIGLATVNELRIDGDDLPGVINAIDYIAELRQSKDRSALSVGGNIIVLGGGMTAIDIAVQSKRLGAPNVTIAYRRGPEQMGASRYEQQLAQTNGVLIRHWLQPKRMIGKQHVHAVDFAHTAIDQAGKLVETGDILRLEADVVFKAIGQALDATPLPSALTMSGGKLSVDEEFRTSLDGVWAGGDCVQGGDDLTVSAVQHGKLAAISIDRRLRGT